MKFGLIYKTTILEKGIFGGIVMEFLKEKCIKGILDKLEKAGVEYLQFDAYNEIEYSEKYQQEYIDLFEEIVVKHIFKCFNIDSQNNETIVNYFGKENGKWFVSFYEPQITANVEDILNNDYASLKELKNW